MQEILMTPDVCMRFLVWSYYYHDVMPEKTVSYKRCGKFTDEDAARLDELKDMLFKCFEEQSVANACRQFQLAKIRKVIGLPASLVEVIGLPLRLSKNLVLSCSRS